MDFVTARKLMDQVKAASVIFAQLSRDIDLLDEPERTRLLHGLGHTMGEMYDGLMRPIGDQYPELDPARPDQQV